MEKCNKGWFKNTKYGILFFLGIFFIFLYLNGLNDLKLEKIYYVTQVIGIGIAAIGVIIATRQYMQTSKNEITKFENDQVQKAIDLAEYYKDKILKNMVLINNVYTSAGMVDIMNKVKKSDLKNFDEHELDDIFTNSDKEDLKKIMMSDEFCKSVGIIGRNHNIDVFDKRIEKDKDGKPICDENGNPKIYLKINKSKVSELFMNKVVVDTLNSLEFFSMHFVHNTANDSVVYQSLHKTYLDAVQVLYYNIAINNKSGGEKFFTNTICLYNKWQKKSQEIKKKEVEHSRSVVDEGKVANSMG